MKALERPFMYLFLIIFFVISVFPFYWMFVLGSHTTAATNSFPPVFIPGDLYMENIGKVFDQVRFVRAILNTTFIASIVTISQLFFCSLAAFAFSRINFKGSQYLFLFVLATLMIPGQLGLVPTYILMTKFGWINDMRAVIVPGLVAAFGVFWMKQYMDSTVHPELIESARIDGCGNFQTYYKIVLPTVTPALATLGILTFMFVWNDFLWPVIVLKTPEVQTIQIALRNLNTVYYRDNAMIMAGTFLATLPLLVVFLGFARHFISGITAGAVKG
jgi:cellobiose transport system permease protein